MAGWRTTVGLDFLPYGASCEAVSRTKVEIWADLPFRGRRSDPEPPEKILQNGNFIVDKLAGCSIMIVWNQTIQINVELLRSG